MERNDYNVSIFSWYLYYEHYFSTLRVIAIDSYIQSNKIIKDYID